MFILLIYISLQKIKSLFSVFLIIPDSQNAIYCKAIQR